MLLCLSILNAFDSFSHDTVISKFKKNGLDETAIERVKKCLESHSSPGEVIWSGVLVGYYSLFSSVFLRKE